MSKNAKRKNSTENPIGSYRGIGFVLFGVSGIINLLALTGSFYMLQIYDRALTSHSIPTLAALSALAIGLYLFQGMFDILRSQILVRLGARLDAKLAPLAHHVVIEMARYGYSTSEALERGRDVDVVRGFLGSQAPIAFFDLPWMPLFLGFVYLLHPVLGLVTLAGAVVLMSLTVATELLTRRAGKETHQAAVLRSTLADSHARNADILRALAPIDSAIGNWKVIAAARRSFNRLKQTLAAAEDGSHILPLPKPCASLKVEGITVVAPGSGTVLVGEVGFELNAGEALGLIGPSGGGKTSLAKGLVGVWPLLRGKVRLDEADLDQWRADALGEHIGYLPQDVSLLDGSIAENISRFETEPDARKIIAAAKAAGIHEMVTRMPDGYQTELGPSGTALSAGQRQRVGLARALYGDPFLVVLDEPNSNLDAPGEAALGEAIEGVKARGGIVIVIAHRPKALAAVDYVGVVQAGKLVAFGPKDKVVGAPAAPIPFPTAATA